MATMFFKATRRKSNSYGAYRQIQKSGDNEDLSIIDQMKDSDDEIMILLKDGSNIIIDCDKKTGVFKIQLPDNNLYFKKKSNMLPQEQVQGLIPEINKVSIEKIRVQTSISEMEEELKESELYMSLSYAKQHLENCEKREQELREQGKQIMLDNGLKKFELLDGSIVQLNSTPGALVIAEGVKLDDKYYKEKVTVSIDKVMVKKDFMEGLILDPGVTIESSYNFVIKSK